MCWVSHSLAIRHLLPSFPTYWSRFRSSYRLFLDFLKFDLFFPIYHHNLLVFVLFLLFFFYDNLYRFKFFKAPLTFRIIDRITSYISPIVKFRSSFVFRKVKLFPIFVGSVLFASLDSYPRESSSQRCC